MTYFASSAHGWICLAPVGEMPALGNKGKVFCSFVEYHWDSGCLWTLWMSKERGLNHLYNEENKTLNVILALKQVGLACGNRLASSTRRPGMHRPRTARDKPRDGRRRFNR